MSKILGEQDTWPADQIRKLGEQQLSAVLLEYFNKVIVTSIWTTMHVLQCVLYITSSYSVLTIRAMHL